jgi:tetratricopeptide (TPR) repeat protein
LILLKQGKKQEAINDLNNAIGIQPNDPHCLVKLAEVLFKEDGQLQRAINFAEKALKINP